MEKLSENPIREFIEKCVKDLIPVIVQEGSETLVDIKQDAKEAWSDFLRKVKEKKYPDYIVAEEVELLNSRALLEIAKKYIVKDSNEVYALKKQDKNSIIVYLAYGKDKTPLEKEHNKYVIIKAEGLSADVLGMFDKSELVILK